MNFINIDMSIKSWIYVGLVFAVILIPLFMTLTLLNKKSPHRYCDQQCYIYRWIPL